MFIYPTFLTCATRELYEETNVKIKLSNIPQLYHEFINKPTIYYVVQISENVDLRMNDPEEVPFWMTMEEIKEHENILQKDVVAFFESDLSKHRMYTLVKTL